LRLVGELAFGLAHLLVADPHPGGLALADVAPAASSSRRSFWAVSDGC